MRLQGKHAIITGAGRGLGRGIALKLAAEGARVVAADVNDSAARETAALIQGQGGEALAVAADVTSRASVSGMMRAARERFGPVDVLVNNAGWDKVEPFVKSNEETWERVLAVNLKGPLYCCHEVLPEMLERGYGKIVNIGSDAGRVGSSGEAVYSAAKGGVIAFTKTLARETARRGINVNCVCPGPSDTPLFHEIRGYQKGLMEALEKAIPMHRLGRPEDVANAVAFLASDEAAYITGQTLSVSGGLTMV